jgi:hypothetical protein
MKNLKQVRMTNKDKIKIVLKELRESIICLKIINLKSLIFILKSL